LFENQQKMKL